MASDEPELLLELVEKQVPASEAELVDMEISRAVALTKIAKYDSVLATLNALESQISDLTAKDQFAIAYQRARAYYFKGEYEVGIQFALESVSIAEADNIDSLIIVGKMFTGELYRASDNDQFALKYLTESRDLALQTDHKLGLAYSTNRIGVVVFNAEEFEKADSLFSASMAIASRILDINVITMNLNDLGELYFALDQPERSVGLYKEALDLDLPLDVEINTYNNLANAYWKIGNYEDGISAASTALTMADEAGILTLSERASRIIADCHMALGDYENGIVFYRRYMNYRGRLFDARKDAQIAELETKYEVEKNRIRLESQERELAAQRRDMMFLIIGVSILGLLLVIIGIVYSKSRKLQKALAESNEIKDKLFAIVSHDLRSSLSAFQGIGQLLDKFLITGQEEKLAATVKALDKEATELHHLLDNLLNWSLSEMKAVGHNPEILDVKPIVDSVVSLMQAPAKVKDVELRSAIEPCMVEVDKNALELVLRNLISNAIKFTNADGYVEVRCLSNSGFVEFEVLDTGTGMDGKTWIEMSESGFIKSSDGTAGEKGTGLGLKICSEFLKRHSSVLEMEENQPNGTIFRFRLARNE